MGRDLHPAESRGGPASLLCGVVATRSQQSHSATWVRMGQQDLHCAAVCGVGAGDDGVGHPTVGLARPAGARLRGSDRMDGGFRARSFVVGASYSAMNLGLVYERKELEHPRSLFALGTHPQLLTKNFPKQRGLVLGEDRFNIFEGGESRLVSCCDLI